jgi:hypothetical protein
MRILRENSIHLDEMTNGAIDWRRELGQIRERLRVDVVGIDTYPNYLLKVPVLGEEAGRRVAEARALTGKRVVNLEFGYSTYRNAAERAILRAYRMPSPSEMQLRFFQNTLNGLEGSESAGTFPWVLMSRPSTNSNPKQESWFGLFKMNDGRVIKKEPAFDYYVDWLRRTMKLVNVS